MEAMTIVKLGLIALLLVGSVVAETMVVTASRLNVRARAGTQYEVICQVVRDQEVKVVERQGDWIGRCHHPSRSGSQSNRAIDASRPRTRAA